jgi:hypothetical protein
MTPTAAVLGCSLAFAGSIGLAVVGVWATGDSSKDLAVWWTAVATSLAFVMAGAAAWSTWQTLQVERTRDTERLQLEYRAQASTIAAWTHQIRKGDEWVEFVVRARNASLLPVYMTIIRLEVGVRGTFYRQLDRLAPSETREVVVYLPGYPRSSLVEPALLFTDARGQAWKRERGRLEEADANDYQHFQTRDPGAYESEESHPTLSLPNGHDEHRGRSV